MADVTDVQDALVAAIAQLMYPNGTAQSSTVSVPVKIYAGWPQSSQLDADLAGLANGKGAIHITVYPSGSSSNTTRYSTALQTLSTSVATVTMTIAGNTVTVGGTVSVPQNVGLLIGNAAYTYAVQQGDTTTSIATALAALVSGATNDGAVITVPSTLQVRSARAGGSGTMYSEISREKQPMQITVWADTPDHRTAAAKLIKASFDATQFMTMTDGSAARMVFQSSVTDDGSQRANLYRRDLIYSLEYATTQLFDTTEIIVQEEIIGVAIGDTVQTIATIYE